MSPDRARWLPAIPPADMAERGTTFWLPVAIAIALLIGVGYYFYGHTWNASPTMRADSGAITKSEPSPN
jgi:hypothetical protein